MAKYLFTVSAVRGMGPAIASSMFCMMQDEAKDHGMITLLTVSVYLVVGLMSLITAKAVLE